MTIKEQAHLEFLERIIKEKRIDYDYYREELEEAEKQLDDFKHKIGLLSIQDLPF